MLPNSPELRLNTSSLGWRPNSPTSAVWGEEVLKKPSPNTWTLGTDPCEAYTLPLPHGPHQSQGSWAHEPFLPTDTRIGGSYWKLNLMILASNSIKCNLSAHTGNEKMARKQLLAKLTRTWVERPRSQNQGVHPWPLKEVWFGASFLTSPNPCSQVTMRLCAQQCSVHLSISQMKEVYIKKCQLRNQVIGPVSPRYECCFCCFSFRSHCLRHSTLIKCLHLCVQLPPYRKCHELGQTLGTFWCRL